MATRLYIDGEWAEASAGSIPTHDPATAKVIEEVGTASESDVDAAVSAARAALGRPEWAGMLPVQRAAVLFKLAELIEAHVDELAALEPTIRASLSAYLAT